MYSFDPEMNTNITLKSLEHCRIAYVLVIAIPDLEDVSNPTHISRTLSANRMA